LLTLRILLFGGLVLHKLVWEILKNPGSSLSNGRKPMKIGIKTIIKTLKIVVLIMLVVQTLFLNILKITDEQSSLRLIGIVIYLIGLLLAIIGRLNLGKNWANLEDYQVLSCQLLVNTGIYRYIRHPIYFGDVLLVLGLELALNSWLVIGVTVLLVIVVRQALAEEAILIKAFPGYSEYRRNTKMFIPFII
jgi:protein-S-isoprenylcysteine O-methyltransferase Ste14